MSYSCGSTLTATTTNSGGGGASGGNNQQHRHHQIFDSNRQKFNDKFRFGSYVVHSPPTNYKARDINHSLTQPKSTTTTTSYPINKSQISKLPSPITTNNCNNSNPNNNGNSKSQIPAYSFKNKTNSFDLSTTTTNSPKRSQNISVDSETLVPNFNDKKLVDNCENSQQQQLNVVSPEFKQNNSLNKSQKYSTTQQQVVKNNNHQDKMLSSSLSPQSWIISCNKNPKSQNHCNENNKQQQSNNRVVMSPIEREETKSNSSFTKQFHSTSTNGVRSNINDRFPSLINPEQLRQIDFDNQVSPKQNAYYYHHNRFNYRNNNDNGNQDNNNFQNSAGDSWIIKENENDLTKKEELIKTNIDLSPTIDETNSNKSNTTNNNDKQQQEKDQIQSITMINNINHDHNNSYKNEFITKLTPRLPRGVSKIPIVNSIDDSNNCSNSSKINGDITNNTNENVILSNNNCNIVIQSDQNKQQGLFIDNNDSIDHINSESLDNPAKYLTFNKDLTTSQIQSLREELLFNNNTNNKSCVQNYIDNNDKFEENQIENFEIKSTNCKEIIVDDDKLKINTNNEKVQIIDEIKENVVNQHEQELNQQAELNHHKEEEEIEEIATSTTNSNDNTPEQSLISNMMTNNNSCDRDSARRLAKRLYNLSGFKKSDVCHHLSKNNPFSQTVAEEYLKLFDFRSMKLDSALRKFLSKLQLNGETQERERILSQFSQRFFDCNKEKYFSADTVQTLVCALILLNTDLHGLHSKKKRAKLSLGAFIDGLNNSIASSIDQCDSNTSNNSNLQQADSTTNIITTTTNKFDIDNNKLENNNDKHSKSGGSVGLNNNNNIPLYKFPRHLLVDLYESIKKRPLKCSDDKCDLTSFEAELDKIYNQQQFSHNNNNNRSNTLPTRRFAPGSNAPSSTMSASSRRHFQNGLIKLNRLSNGSQNQQQDDYLESTIEFKSDYLNRKRIFEANGKPTSKGRRGWKKVHVSLKDLRLIMRTGVHKDESSVLTEEARVEEEAATTTSSTNSPNINKTNTANKQQQAKGTRFKLLAQDMKNTVKIHHSFAKRSTTYTKRDFVFHLRLANQSEFLFQANNELDLINWIDTINFASACLSSPALPNAISNSNNQQKTRKASLTSSPTRSTVTTRQLKPLYPSSYTRLSYWEQLMNHEDRLQRLKVELDEHLGEAPNTMNANKRFKTEYIEKIAYLKQEIERYSIYVDLMGKKSNSPEAIVLSKHPQIASSFTASPEMVKSLPSFGPPVSNLTDEDTALANK